MKKTRKFGKLRYVIKWDSAFFNGTVKDKKAVTEYVMTEYYSRGYKTRMTTYNKGKDFKVWVIPE